MFVKLSIHWQIFRLYTPMLYLMMMLKTFLLCKTCLKESPVQLVLTKIKWQLMQKSFISILEHTHSLDPCQTPPSHTIIIKAADYVILPATNAYTMPILNATCTCFTLIVKHFTHQHNFNTLQISSNLH